MTIRLSNRLNALEADLNRPGEDVAFRERLERAKARVASYRSPEERSDHEARTAAMRARIRAIADGCCAIGMRPTLAMLLGAARREG